MHLFPRILCIYRIKADCSESNRLAIHVLDCCAQKAARVSRIYKVSIGGFPGICLLGVFFGWNSVFWAIFGFLGVVSKFFPSYTSSWPIICRNHVLQISCIAYTYNICYYKIAAHVHRYSRCRAWQCDMSFQKVYMHFVLYHEHIVYVFRNPHSMCNQQLQASLAWTSQCTFPAQICTP